MLKDTSVLQNYLLDEIREDCLQDLIAVVLATEDIEMAALEQVIPLSTLKQLSEMLPISRAAMARFLTALAPGKTEGYIDLFLPITKEFSEARRRLKMKIKLQTAVSSRATSVASSVINEERVYDLPTVVNNDQSYPMEMNDAKEQQRVKPVLVKLQLSLKSKKKLIVEETVSRRDPEVESQELTSPLPTDVKPCSSWMLDPTLQENPPLLSSTPVEGSPITSPRTVSMSMVNENENGYYQSLSPEEHRTRTSVPVVKARSTNEEPVERNHFPTDNFTPMFAPSAFQISGIQSMATNQTRRNVETPEIEMIIPQFSRKVRVRDLPSGQSEFESLSSLVKAVKDGKKAHVEEPRPTMHRECFPDEEILDVVVGEIVDPSTIYIQKACKYDELNVMMDELDMFYQKLGYSQTEEEAEARVKQLLMVGDHVATIWTDQMWYRARITHIINNDTFEVFYIDYGTKMKVKRRELFLLDARFFELSAQAIKAEMAGIEPLIDEAHTYNWTGPTTRRILELTNGSHLNSLVAIITYRKKDKLGIWLLDQAGRGINEILVEERLARYTDNDDKLNELVSSTVPIPNEKEVQILDQVAELHGSVMKDHIAHDPLHQHHLIARSIFLFEDLWFMETATKNI